LVTTLVVALTLAPAPALAQVVGRESQVCSRSTLMMYVAKDIPPIAASLQNFHFSSLESFTMNFFIKDIWLTTSYRSLLPAPSEHLSRKVARVDSKTLRAPTFSSVPSRLSSSAPASTPSSSKTSQSAPSSLPAVVRPSSALLPSQLASLSLQLSRA
jgi:hypothetical protein